jgi:hypothetical protein
VAGLWHACCMGGGAPTPRCQLFLHSAIKGRRERQEKLHIEAAQTPLASFSSSVFVCTDQGSAPPAIKVVRFSGVFPTIGIRARGAMAEEKCDDSGASLGKGCSSC